MATICRAAIPAMHWLRAIGPLGAVFAAAALVAPAPAAAQGDAFARAREDIDRFCKGDSRCVARQRDELDHFVTLMAAFRDAGNANARRCMERGKSGSHIDWVIAADCMRAAVEGRRIGE